MLRRGRRAAPWRAAAVVAALVVGLLVPAGAAEPPGGADAGGLGTACRAENVVRGRFADLAGNVHAFAVDCLAGEPHRIVRGHPDGTYGPAAPVRRDQLAGFVARTLAAAGVELPDAPASRFTDTTGSVFAAEIEQLAAAGIVRGLADGRFGPAQPVTRAQAATFLVEAYWYATAAALPEDPGRFGDIGDGPHALAIARAAGLGIVQGRAGGGFDPQAVTRRDQVASLLARVLERILADGALGSPRFARDGFVFLDGGYVPPRYRVETDGFAVLVNGVAVRSIEPPEPSEDPPPDDPRSAVDLLHVAAARLAELGGTRSFLPSALVIDELVAVVSAYPATSEVRIDRDAGLLSIRDRAGEEADLVLAAPAALLRSGTDVESRRAAAQTAAELSALLAAGGTVVAGGDELLTIPAQATAEFLHGLVGAFALPASEHAAALADLAGPVLGPLLAAAGDPTDAIGARLPPAPDPLQPEAAGAARVEALDHGHSRRSRTPRAATRLSLSGVQSRHSHDLCVPGPMITAAHLHGYRAAFGRPFGIGENLGVLAHGPVGLLYICPGPGGSLETKGTAASAEEARERYDAVEPGLGSGLRVVSWTGTSGAGGFSTHGTRFGLRPTPEWLATHPQWANTIVYMRHCPPGDLVRAFAEHAREVIVPLRGCWFATLPEDRRDDTRDLEHAPMERDFWGRLAGTVDEGHARTVGEAFAASFPAGLFAHRSQAAGRTVLSPSVASAGPRGTLPVGANVEGEVRFDAAVADEPRWSPRVSLSGCGLDEPLAPTRTTDSYTYRFPIRPLVPGMLEITVHGHSADTPLASGRHRVVWLTGNTSAPAHVGPTRDGYRWSVACSDDPGLPLDPGGGVHLLPVTGLELTPPEAMRQVGETHAAFAEPTDDFGRRAGGDSVLFEVLGPHSRHRVVDTDVGGTAELVYQGTAPGVDEIRACTNHDGSAPWACEPGEADVIASVLVEWREPGGGGGTVVPPPPEHTLHLRTMSGQLDELEPDEGDRIEADPAKDVYSPGEQVTLTTPGALEAEGFWHCFSHWEVEPDVTHEPDGTVLWLTMDNDVTATAWYDTMEPGLDCEGGAD